MQLQDLLNEIESVTSINDIAGFKRCINASYEWLDNEFDTKSVDSLVVDRATFVDKLLNHSWTLCKLDNIPQMSLVAVGGYGRGHLQPYSDVDLLILSEKGLDKSQEENLSQWITFLWDIGLDIGQSVRTIKETIHQAKKDITIATNLIESRLLNGCETTFDKLQSKIHGAQFWSSKDFFVAKYEEQQQRHTKFNGTAYNLEPNIKENPGCLRDIQNIGWVAKKHFKVLQGKELIEHGYFTENEFDELLECRSYLWKMRFALHMHVGRSENRLLFDYQPAVAQRLGFGDEGKSSVEKMMKSFFRIVRRISELNEMLLQLFRQDILANKVKRKEVLDDDFEVLDGLIAARHDNVFETPEKLLNFFSVIAKSSSIEGLHSSSLRLLRNARRQFNTQYFSERGKCRVIFMQLVQLPDFFRLSWDLMYKHGIMQAYLSQWDHIVGMMQFDLFHAYTVDEHTHRLVKNIHHYTLDLPDHPFPRCRRMMMNVDKPELLFIAGIFHDIAKGRNGDHSTLGAADVANFCVMHNVSEKDTKLVSWLVEQHLLMSVVAQRRDIYDPEVVNDFAAKVRNKNNLNHLYMLTLADIRATNSNLWNDWKSSLLRELYLMTRKALEDGLENKVDLHDRILEHKELALNALHEEGYKAEHIEHLWQRFDNSYFIRFKSAQLAWHAKVILQHETTDEEGLIIDLNEKTSKAGTEVLIYGKDRPNLFAQAASVLDSRNCSIHDANILNTQDGYIFDTFVILDNNGKRIDSQNRMQSLKEAIHNQLNKPGEQHKNQRRMSRRMRQLKVPTKMRFFTNQSNMTLLELEALDSPGLLARISEQFVKLNIDLHMAKISTIGERAEDLFILSNPDKKALSQEQQTLLKSELTKALDKEYKPAYMS
ncbi:[protein-PII] uridylyltransferase [Alteromonadaceae bacterium M269]|nr:[protein-PII] uridylyltransferase [Alteromonadaceae bacterium M269]